ncbi:MAG: DUF1269 domain-containing protein [Gammaproteobacteria bacterium]|nr:DUF1269 domain-containing protein [Gammaproteobacteria bacterium]
MQRLYFVIPTVQSCRMIVNELLLARISDKQMHVMAKDDQVPRDLPQANLLQTSDFVPAVERGITIGGGTGLFAGILAYSFQSAGLEIGGFAILAICLAGGGIGAWIAGMIGVDVPNTQLKPFMPALNAGSLLLIVDVKRSRVTEIEEMIKNLHPEATDHGVEASLPVFP